ncbi:MAG TPA: glutamate synthase-related protein, partial [Stellaceae bacterium]|nr:glutamate synthase-related protein [Stellaceae bacterium]
TSIHHAGEPWEIGLAETHQTLVLNGLRGRIAVQVDGGLRSGRDVVVGAMLGADEFGFATAALIAAGCVMMRKCHLNTCPVGVATQDPELRKRFVGKPEEVINFLMFVAEETREIMASLGFRRFNDMIGRTDFLEPRKVQGLAPLGLAKIAALDFARILHRPAVAPGTALHFREPVVHRLADVLDHTLIARAREALEECRPVTIDLPIRNGQRAVGAMLSGEVAKRYGDVGLPDDTIHIGFTGTAGQSFGAFLARGVTLDLEGQANDYVGKGLSGGRLVIRPPRGSLLARDKSIIIGNTVLYGAIAGECYFGGVAGERFAVRNSGALAVVEGVGAHACEYMTGGVVVILGDTGTNFAAGMSGGVAFVLDEAGAFERRCNKAMIELEAVEDDLANEELSGDLGRWGDFLAAGDGVVLKTMLMRHATFTGSPKALEILGDWPAWRGKFVKIVPIEYRRALQQMAEGKRPELAVAAGS